MLALVAAALAASAAPEQQILRLLDDQRAAWNRGDLEGYMAGYWRSPELTFFSGASITKGWQPTLERYKKRYQGEGREMGKLQFSSIDVQPLGADAALVRGEWRLTFSKRKDAHGMFTLLVKRMDDGFRIVHDHSSGE